MFLDNTDRNARVSSERRQGHPDVPRDVGCSYVGIPRSEIRQGSALTMICFEDNTQVFIVRIWLERRELENAPTEWRGIIEHLASGAHRYFQHRDDISAFIQQYVPFNSHEENG